MGVSARNALSLMIWLCIVIAFASIITWLDYQTVRIGGDDDLIGLRFENAWLVSAVACATSIIARRMLGDPNELMWALTVAAGSLTFVLLGTELSSMGPVGCGDFLAFLSFFCARGDGTTFWLLGAKSSLFLWGLKIASLISVLLVLFLPIIETIERRQFAQEE